MSKFKITISASAGVGNEATEVIDLVDDWGYTEEEAKQICETRELDAKDEELIYDWACMVTGFDYGFCVGDYGEDDDE